MYSAPPPETTTAIDPPSDPKPWVVSPSLRLKRLLVLRPRATAGDSIMKPTLESTPINTWPRQLRKIIRCSHGTSSTSVSKLSKAIIYMDCRYCYGHMQRDCETHGLPVPSETETRECSLGPETAAPDPLTVKDFAHFYVARSRGLIADRPTSGSMNSRLECFFAGFTRVTGTPTVKEEQMEVYSVNAIDITRGICQADKSTR